MKHTLPVVAMLLSALTLQAGDAMTLLTSSAASALVLQGSSNVTDWRCRGTSLDGQMEVAASLEKINTVMDRIEDGNIGIFMAQPAEGRFPQPRFQMRIPVSALQCGNGAMERDLRKALKADRYPVIDFRYKELRGGITHDIDTNVYSARVAGELMLAGARRDIEVTIVARRIGRDQFRLRAELPLRMTDFGVTPPTALFGMVKAKNDLTVQFDLIMGNGTADVAP